MRLTMRELHDTDSDDRLLTRAELCQRLGVASRTLEEWTRRGYGPPLIHLTARVVRYRLADVRAWLADRERAA